MGIEVMGTTAYQGTRMPQQMDNAGKYQSEMVSFPGSGQVDKVIAPIGKSDSSNPQGGNQEQKQPSEQQIKSEISLANKRGHFGNTSAQFSYHEGTKRISVKIIDKDTQEVIKEIPPEETLEMISKMWEMAGILVDEKR